MEVRHYYHIYAAGAWAPPVREHFAALGEVGFDGDITIGLVGPEEDRKMCREMTEMHLRSHGLPAATWVEDRDGWEQVTLRQIYRDVHVLRGDFAVLYAHTKGARDDSDWNALWRRSMQRHVVSGWSACAKLLDGGYDAAGCHWLTPEKHNNPPDYPVNSPFFGGNYWMARASYLRTLPPPGTEYRHQAEEWVGRKQPLVYDLLPGWPTVKLCS